MKKTLIFTLTALLLCGCASQNNSNSKDIKNETETTTAAATVQETSTSAVTETQTVTTTISTTTSAEDDEDFVWLEKGVYEYGRGERDHDLPYDNRFQGEFYSFFDEEHGVTWDAYEGITSYFTCEQKKTKSFSI